ncbi:hypothetical protein PTKIN_Ptkin04bG0024800 [Pterospermum kingtungense]
MDWNLKSTPWGLTEFVEEAVPSMDEVNGSSSYNKVPRIKGDFSVDLKLGQVGNSGEESVNKWKMEFSPTKRARASNNRAHKVSCLVDECNSDLSKCREYHRRHKVCELHSKTAQVLINGHKQRFCQQCSRFHSLEEFDEGKRSCRKRLDGHNRRRRKPKRDHLSRSGSYFSNNPGTQMLQFSSLHVYPSTAVEKPTWPGVTNSETNLHSPEIRNLVVRSSSSNCREGKQFTFLQVEDKTLHNQTDPEASVCHGMFYDKLATTTQDSDCALSLLSSPQSQTSGISLCNMVMVQPHSFTSMQPLSPSLQNHIIEPMDSVAVSNAMDATVRCPGMFNMGSGGSSGSEAPQTFPFHWQ